MAELVLQLFLFSHKIGTMDPFEVASFSIHLAQDLLYGGKIGEKNLLNSFRPYSMGVFKETLSKVVKQLR